MVRRLAVPAPGFWNSWERRAQRVHYAVEQTPRPVVVQELLDHRSNEAAVPGRSFQLHQHSAVRYAGQCDQRVRQQRRSHERGELWPDYDDQCVLYSARYPIRAEAHFLEALEALEAVMNRETIVAA